MIDIARLSIQIFQMSRTASTQLLPDINTETLRTRQLSDVSLARMQAAHGNPDTSPSLRALLKQYDARPRHMTSHDVTQHCSVTQPRDITSSYSVSQCDDSTSTTRSTLYKYLESKTRRHECSSSPPRKYRKALPRTTATVSSARELESLLQNREHGEVTSLSRARKVSDNDTLSANVKSEHDNFSMKTSHAPALTAATAAIQLQVSHIKQESSASWDIATAKTEADVQDPKTAYIISNLRAGLREQHQRSLLLKRRKLVEGSFSNGIASGDIHQRDDSAAIRCDDNKHTLQDETETFKQALSDLNDDVGMYRKLPSPLRLLQQVQSTIPACDAEQVDDDALSRSRVTEKSGSHKAVQCVLLPSAACSSRLTTDLDADDTMSLPVASTEGHTNNEVAATQDEHRCQHCNISFHDVILHSIHMGCHNRNEPFCCNVCGSQCADKYGFYTHIMRGHHSTGS